MGLILNPPQTAQTPPVTVTIGAPQLRVVGAAPTANLTAVDNTDALNGTVIDIAGTTYTFVTVLSGADYEIRLQGSLFGTFSVLQTALVTPGDNANYKVSAAHPFAYVSLGGLPNMVFSSIQETAAYNGTQVTTDVATLAASSPGTFLNGVDPVEPDAANIGDLRSEGANLYVCVGNLGDPIWASVAIAPYV